MRYQVPQFLERETKIFGPLTFRQFIYIGIAGAIIFVLYFAMGEKNFPLFLLISVILLSGSSALAFLNISGKSLPAMMGNFLTYLFTSRIYLWKHRGVPPQLIKVEKKPEKEKPAEGPVLKIAGKGRLEKLSTKIETGVK